MEDLYIEGYKKGFSSGLYCGGILAHGYISNSISLDTSFLANSFIFNKTNNEPSEVDISNLEKGVLYLGNPNKIKEKMVIKSISKVDGGFCFQVERNETKIFFPNGEYFEIHKD